MRDYVNISLNENFGPHCLTLFFFLFFFLYLFLFFRRRCRNKNDRSAGAVKCVLTSTWAWCRGLGPARPRGIKRCLSVTPEREGEGEMRSDAIRCDPSHRTHRRRTLLKIITALDCGATSVASVVGAHTHGETHTHRSATAGIEFRGSFVSRWFYLCFTLSLPLTLTCCLAVPFALCRFDIYLFFCWT